MTTTLEQLDLPARDPAPTTRRPGHGFLSELEGQPAFGFIGPNWFASVMGTGIVVTAAAGLPVHVPGLLAFARVVWLLDVAWLLAVITATTLHWRHHRAVARGHLDDPVMSHFYGAPAMALMVVGAGAVLVGQPILGHQLAIGLDAVLWTVGTALGLWTAVTLPYLTFTRADVRGDSAFGGWLMPVVPPMVSAATGPLLIPSLPAGQWQLTMQLACTAMFGLTLGASAIVIGLIWARLARYGVGAAVLVPTLWIVLGPLGQSITAAHALGTTAAAVLPAPAGAAFSVAGLVYGVPTWGFAMLWAAVAAAITIRTLRTGLPFALTWWSFTFPIGTVVTGTSALAVGTGSHALAAAALASYVVLLGAWGVVASRTAQGIFHGRLLRAPAPLGA